MYLKRDDSGPVTQWLLTLSCFELDLLVKLLGDTDSNPVSFTESEEERLFKMSNVLYGARIKLLR